MLRQYIEQKIHKYIYIYVLSKRNERRYRKKRTKETETLIGANLKRIVN